jgi:predicted nucleic acid-binding protein
MTETCHLLVARLSVDAELAFLRSFEAGSFVVSPLTDEHAPRICALMEKYRNLPMDLADASLVILAEDMGSGRILSTDRRDFDTYRFKNHEPFHNLLVP